MSRAFPAYLAWAYFRSAHTKFASSRWIARGAMLGLALSLMILLMTLSVMNGFERDIRKKLLTKSPHIIAFHTHSLEIPEKEENRILEVEKAYQVRLLMPQLNYQQIYASITDRVDTRQISTSLFASQNLLSLLDFIGIRPQTQSFSHFSLTNFTSFEDSSPLILLPMKDFASVKDLGPIKIQGFWLKDPFDVDAVSHALKEQYPHVKILSWKDQHQSFFDAFSGEKRLISIVLSLMIVLIYVQFALTLVLIFNDKKQDLIVLSSCCDNKKMVYETFFLYGCYNVLFGILIGLMSGAAFSYFLPAFTEFVEKSLGFQFLPYQHYSSQTLPSELQFGDFFYTGLFALTLGILTSHILARHGQSKAQRGLTYKRVL